MITKHFFHESQNIVKLFPPRRRKREAEDSLLNSVDAVATEEERPVLRRIAALGSAMWKPECQAEIFCQVISLNYNICTRYIAVFIYMTLKLIF